MTIDIQGVITDLEGAVLDAKTGFAELTTLISYLSLQNDDLSAANVSLQAQLDTARAEIERLKNPPPPAPVVKTVKDYGAKGDGVTDDTDAFNKAAATGSLIVPPGDYLIDPVKRVSIQLSKTVVRMDQAPGAVKIRAKTNAAPRYRIFNVNGSDCDIDLGGAHFIGDRATHVWQKYGKDDTHEWGYCFFLGGQRNKLYGAMDADGKPLGLITGATGDGLGVTGQGHEVYGLKMDGNRRQGCSAFNAGGLKFHHNICRNTGNAGQPDPAPVTLIGPFCGFDCEPDGGDCLGVDIGFCEFGPNNRSGAIFWVNSRAGVVKLSGSFHDNLVTGNSNGNWFCDEVAGRYNITLDVKRNRYVNNKANDVKCDQGTVVTVGGSQEDANIFDDFNDRTAAYRNGVVSPEIGVYRSARVSAGTNRYV